MTTKIKRAKTTEIDKVLVPRRSASQERKNWRIESEAALNVELSTIFPLPLEEKQIHIARLEKLLQIGRALTHRSMSDETIIVRLLSRLGTLYYQSNQWELGIARSKEAISFFRQLNRYIERRIPKHDHQLTDEEATRLNAYVTQFTECSMQQATAIIEATDYLQSQNNLSVARKSVEEGSWHQGLERLNEALSGFRTFDDPKSKAETLLAIGDVRQRFGDYEMARMSYSDAERHFRKLSDQTGEAMARLKRGTVELQLQDIPTAKAHLQAASDYFHKIGDTERIKLSDEWLALAQRMEQMGREVPA